MDIGGSGKANHQPDSHGYGIDNCVESWSPLTNRWSHHARDDYHAHDMHCDRADAPFVVVPPSPSSNHGLARIFCGIASQIPRGRAKIDFQLLEWRAPSSLLSRSIIASNTISTGSGSKSDGKETLPPLDDSLLWLPVHRPQWMIPVECQGGTMLYDGQGHLLYIGGGHRDTSHGYVWSLAIDNEQSTWQREHHADLPAIGAHCNISAAIWYT